MSHHSPYSQDVFLKHALNKQTEIEITFLHGAALKGLVCGFDNYTISMRVGEMYHLVYKHAVAQIVGPEPPQTAKDATAPDHNARHKRRHPKKKDEKPREKAKPKEKEGPKEKFNALDFSDIKIASEEPEAAAEVPEEPGFEAACAIAGLLAVGYLVLRKKQ